MFLNSYTCPLFNEIFKIIRLKQSARSVIVFGIPVFVGKKVLSSKTFKCVMSDHKFFTEKENPESLFTLSHARKTNKGLSKKRHININGEKQ